MPGTTAAGGSEYRTLADALDGGVARHSDLPKHLQLSFSARDFTTALHRYCVDRLVPFAKLPDVLRTATDPVKYTKELLTNARERLRLYPYHMIDDAVLLGRQTPKDFYTAMLSNMLKGESTYDALPNFTAVDIARLFKIGRNEYIDLLQRSKQRSSRWVLKTAYNSDLLPTKLADDVALAALCVVRPVPYTQEEVLSKLEPYFPPPSGASQPPHSSASTGETVKSESKPSPFNFWSKAKSEATSQAPAPAALGLGESVGGVGLCLGASMLKVYHDVCEPVGDTKPGAAAAMAAPPVAPRPTTTSLFGFRSVDPGAALHRQPLRRLVKDGVSLRACQLPKQEVEMLQQIGLVYSIVNVSADDMVEVKPLTQFVMNRGPSDWVERLLYAFLCSFDEGLTIAENAADLAGLDEPPLPNAQASGYYGHLTNLVWGARVLAHLGIVSVICARARVLTLHDYESRKPFEHTSSTPLMDPASILRTTQSLLQKRRQASPPQEDPAPAAQAEVSAPATPRGSSPSSEGRATPSEHQANDNEGGGTSNLSRASSPTSSLVGEPTGHVVPLTNDNITDVIVHATWESHVPVSPPLKGATKARHRKRICLLYDGPMAGRIMMSAQGQAHAQLKAFSVTLFESGKLPYRFVKQLRDLLRPIHENYLGVHAAGVAESTSNDTFTRTAADEMFGLPGAIHETIVAVQREANALDAHVPPPALAEVDCVRMPRSITAAFLSNVSCFYLMLDDFFTSAAKMRASTSDNDDNDDDDDGAEWEMDLMRVESLNSLSPATRVALLKARYRCVVCCNPLTVVPAVDPAELNGWFLGPSLVVAPSAWLRLYIAQQIKRGHPMAVFRRGSRITSALPCCLLQAKGGRPSPNDGVIIQTLLRNDNIEARYAAHSSLLTVNAMLKSDALVVTRDPSFESPVITCVLSFSSTDDVIASTVKRATAFLISQVPPLTPAAMAFLRRRAHWLSVHEQRPVGPSSCPTTMSGSAADFSLRPTETEIEGFIADAAGYCRDVLSALFVDSNTTTSVGCARFALGLELRMPSAERDDVGSALSSSPSHLSINLTSVEFGLSLDPCGFAEQRISGSGITAVLENAMRGNADVSVAMVSEGPATAPQAGSPPRLSRLAQRLHAFYQGVGAVLPCAPERRDDEQAPFLVASETAAVPVPARGPVLFDGADVIVLDANRFHTLGYGSRPVA